ncbi:amidohydrolase family protein [Streptomyces sp. DSM 44915]|uniref:Amidohydrolase family protein n=1 Tax=Streptomyces chisholmiae TaxID=3075540 RepID=A0ABU2JR04_9ACTN|nr:amidohydrolase family protein [Streptomyces sp. DSM 44915]MDT0267406.1 amidohydrolase family protein [Streptomyces sp. DSM 44915]
MPTPAAGGRVIDAHHHLWQVSRQDQPWRTHQHAAIARDFEPEHLRPELARAGVDSTVLVQSVDSPEENDRLAEYARQAPFVAGFVGWLPLARPEAARAELDRIETGALCGVRTLVARDPLGWLTEPGTVRLCHELAERGLAWDVVPVTDEQVRAVTALAGAVPELRIVIDHLARPPVERGDHRAWSERLAALAAHPAVALKVSVGIDVLTAWEHWDRDALLPHVAEAVRHFGPERLMLASNWPVSLLRRDYVGTLADLTDLLARAGLGARAVAMVRGQTAAHWYGIGA